MTVAEEKIEFKTEIQELLHLIIHTLYTHKEIFLRELLSNASDALSKAQFENLTDHEEADKTTALDVHIKVDKDKRTLTVTDTGIGMSREQLITQIGTIAHSGTRKFLSDLKESKSKPEMIGQFGVGFYSVFMVAERVTIDTLSIQPDEPAVRWESDGSGSYTVTESKREQRGTEIVLYLKDDESEFLETSRLKDLVAHHSGYLPFPVYLEGERVTQPEALWRKNKSDIGKEEYEEFFKQLTGEYADPLFYEHITAEMPVQFSSILYIPKYAPHDFYKQQDHKVKLYAHRVFIQENNKALIPSFLRFLKGVVETDDIPLNVSRESVQSNANIGKINTILTKKMLDALAKLAKKDENRYLAFWLQYGFFLKEGAHGEPKYRDKILPLLRFTSMKHTAKPDMSLPAYVENKVEGQKAIYFAIGETLDRLRKVPHLEFFRKNDIDVLLLTQPMDDMVMNAIGEYEGMKLINVESADLELPDNLKEQADAAEVDDKLKVLGEKVKDLLKSKIGDVRFSNRLTDSPCRFYSTQGGPSFSVRKMMTNMEGMASLPLTRDLELNPEHSFIIGLAEKVEDEGFANKVKLLFHVACLLDGDVEEPQELAALMMPLLNQ